MWIRAVKCWWFWLIVAWLCLSAGLIFHKWGAITQFGLGDTDDNLRFLQVRDWIAGQGWFDLRQHRLGPPDGANLHWSRLVDLPIAAIYLIFVPLVGRMQAWQIAVSVSPLLPLLVAMAALAVITRRMIGRQWWPVALVMLGGSLNALYMWMPLRIDHHGWQLALLAWAVAGLLDPMPRRGGLVAGTATVLSLAIGLEFVHYLLLIAALASLDWVTGMASAQRLRMHGSMLALGSLAMWSAFASQDNRLPVCDALSPAWLWLTMGGGALMVALSLVRDKVAWRRLGYAIIGGVPLAIGYVWLFPHCLASPEGLTPELRSLWFENIREVKSVLTRDWRAILSIATVPVFGLLGTVCAWWRERDDRQAARWRSLMLLTLVALLMLLWQTRAAASAQLLGITGATALAAMILNWFRQRHPMLRVAGTLVTLLIISGIAGNLLPRPRIKASNHAWTRTVAQADRECQSAHYLKQLTKLPQGLVMTHVDFGPRLIAMTHHSAVAGPYHRNGPAIVDVMRFFRGDRAQARKIAGRWQADYVLLCPGMPETTIYKARAPKGFYMQLMDGKIPVWLDAVELPRPTPYRLWRVIRPKPEMK